jgi:hypothetical protein
MLGKWPTRIFVSARNPETAAIANKIDSNTLSMVAIVDLREDRATTNRRTEPSLFDAADVCLPDYRNGRATRIPESLR